MISIFVHVFHVIRYIDAKIDLPEFISRNPGATSRQFGLSWSSRLKFKSSFPRFESSCGGFDFNICGYSTSWSRRRSLLFGAFLGWLRLTRYPFAGDSLGNSYTDRETVSELR